jgi:ESCRT-I complex subunit VPS28
MSFEPIKLWTTRREREVFENQADLYALFVTVEQLEKAFVRGVISPEAYTEACTQLIAQFKAAQRLVEDSVPDIEAFLHQYTLNCPAAIHRLLGIPATVEHGSRTSSGNLAKHSAEIVHHFVTIMDALKLNMRAVDHLHPLLVELLSSLQQVNNLLPELASKDRLRAW